MTYTHAGSDRPAGLLTGYASASETYHLKEGALTAD
jgi:hypothetical protein